MKKKTDKNILDNPDFVVLMETILAIEDLETAKLFFRDLLSDKELKEIAVRWRVAWLLYKKIPYKMIISETGVSSTTVARIAKCLQDPDGGYNQLVDLIELE